MSDKYTEVETEAGSLGLWGHIAPTDAIEELRKHYERDLAIAQRVLDEIDAGRVTVFHQYGPWARRGRREVAS